MTTEQKSDLRHAIIEFLYARNLLAFSPAAVARQVVRKGLVDFDVAETDAVEALHLVKELGYVEAVNDKLGNAITYRITAAGVLARERGEI